MKEHEEGREEDDDTEDQRDDTLGAESRAHFSGASTNRGAVAGWRLREASSLLCVTGFLAHGERICHRSLWL